MTQATKTLPPGMRGGFLQALSLYNFGTLELFDSLHKKYGDIYYTDLGFRQFYNLGHPDYVRYVLRENNHNYHKSSAYDEAAHLLGNGLLNSEGEFWRRQRRLVSGAFAKSNLAKLVPAMDECLAGFTTRLEKLARAGQDFDIHHEMMALTLEIISRTMFGASAADHSRSIRDAIEFGNGYINERIVALFNLPILFPTVKNVRFLFSRIQLDNVVNSFIKKRREEGEVGDDLLGRLMHAVDEGHSMTDAQLRDEVMTIFLAGHETTAIALTMVWYFLLKNPLALAKLRAEILPLKDKTPSAEILTDLKYTSFAINEAMRLYPPAWIIGRKAVAEDEIAGYHIKPGVDINFVPYHIHRDERFFDEPLRFKPERFENPTWPKYAFLPFGGGPRTCVGNHFAMLEMLLVVTKIFSRFEFEMPSNYNMEVAPLFTLRPVKPLRLKVKQIR